MARRRAAARQEDLEDFSEELQNLPLEPTSGDEDESYEPVRLPRRNVNRTIPAAGTAADSLPPGMISTVAGTTTNFPVTDSTGVAGDTSDRPPPVILNDPDEGSSRKVRPTDDLAWFFDTDEETGIRTCKLCRYVIIISMVCHLRLLMNLAIATRNSQVSKHPTTLTGKELATRIYGDISTAIITHCIYDKQVS